jgi:hypothetical protein
MPAGSKPGERRGGRSKGTPNAKTVRRKMAAAKGVRLAERMRRSPLEIILTVADGGPEADKITPRMLEAAIAAAPYCHARLAAVAYVPPPDDSRDRRRDMLRRIPYQQRKQIAEIMAAALATVDDGPEIEGEAAEKET